MAFKFLIFAAFVAAANAGLLASPPLQYAQPLAYSAPIAKFAPLQYAAPVAKIATPLVAKTVVPEEYDPHPQYNYGYDVQDTITGDNKEQHEQRDGDIVTGRYALNDADGYRRIVEYTSDPIHGFNAVVRREPLGQLVAKVATPVITKVAAPLTYSAPLVTKTLTAAPLSYAHAPIAYSTPVAKIAAPFSYAAQPTYYH